MDRPTTNFHFLSKTRFWLATSVWKWNCASQNNHKTFSYSSNNNMKERQEHSQVLGSSSRRRPAVYCSLLSTLLVLAAVDTSTTQVVTAFQPSCVFNPSRRTTSRTTHRFSSVGGGGDDATPPKDPNDGDEGGELDDFLNAKQESDNLQKAREFMSESSLPISYEHNEEMEGEETSGGPEELALDPESSALVGAFSSSLFPGDKVLDKELAKNPYMQVVSKLSPSELISKFTATANPRVQEAVRSTILGLIGSLPKMAFDTTTITTGQRLASLMFQLQMTGYMFKNAEYRLSLSQSLGMTNNVSSSNLLLTGATAENDEEQDMQEKILAGKVRGKLRVSLGAFAESFDNSNTDAPDSSSSNNGTEIEVDAAAYMSELRSEVSKLKEELREHTDDQEDQEEDIRKDLLLYIRTLPEQELKSLTNTMSTDVLVCMKGLVQAVLSGIGDGKIAPDTVTEQSGEAMAQLCMWQLAVGYNLRELEVREELKTNLSSKLDHTDDANGGVDLSQPDALQ
jgi:hypothetical protein